MSNSNKRAGPREDGMMAEGDVSLRLLIDALKEPVVIIDRRGTILFCNKALALGLGGSVEGLSSACFYDHLGPDEARLSRERYAAVAAKGETTDFVVARADRVYNERWQPVVDDGGDVCQIGIYTTDITEQKGMEEALKKGEERYRTLFENASDGAFLLRNGVIIDCSARSLGIFRCTRDQIVGRSPGQLSPPFQHDGGNSMVKVCEKIAAALADRPQFFEWRHRRYDGTTFDAEVSLNSLVIDGEALVQAVVRDISARKAAEGLLRESEERYRLITEKSTVGVYLHQEGLFRYVNGAFARLFGYRPEEIIDTYGPLDFVVAEDQPFVLAMLESRMSGVTSGDHYEFRGRRKDGTVIHLEIFGTLLMYQGRRAIHGTIVDITARKEAEKQVAEERQRFLRLSEHAPFGLAMLDAANRYTYVNPKFKALFGYSVDDIPDGTTWLLKAFPDKAERRRAVAAWLSDLREIGVGESRSRVFTATCKDGTAKVINFIPVRIGSGETLISCEDITERKSLEQRLRRMSVMDELTGLYNRRGFFSLAQRQLKLAERAGAEMILFFADLDRMKWINDTYGHQEGDRALVETASILKEAFRATDIVARTGGDEFAILAIHATSKTAGSLIKRLEQHLSDFNSVGSRPYVLTLSTGFAVYDPVHPSALDDLMAEADKAMYKAKGSRRR